MENKKRWRYRPAPEAVETWNSATAGCRMRGHIRETEKLAFAAQGPLVTESVAFVRLPNAG